MSKRYERLAIDGDGDVWGYAAGRWDCLTDSAITETDESLTAGYPPVEIYVPAPPAESVTYDLSDPDARHVLTQALRNYADRQEYAATVIGSDGTNCLTWAAHAKTMLDQAEAAGQ